MTNHWNKSAGQQIEYRGRNHIYELGSYFMKIEHSNVKMWMWTSHWFHNSNKVVVDLFAVLLPWLKLLMVVFSALTYNNNTILIISYLLTAESKSMNVVRPYYFIMCVGDALAIVHVCHVRAHEFDFHQRTPSEWKGQPHCLSLANAVEFESLTRWFYNATLYPVWGLKMHFLMDLEWSFEICKRGNEISCNIYDEVATSEINHGSECNGANHNLKTLIVLINAISFI